MVETQKELSGLPIGEMAAIGLVAIGGVYLIIRSVFNKMRNGLEKRLYGDPNEMVSIGPTGPVK